MPFRWLVALPHSFEKPQPANGVLTSRRRKVNNNWDTVSSQALIHARENTRSQNPGDHFKRYPRRPCISSEVLKPHQRRRRGHVGCDRSPLISPLVLHLTTPRNHTLRMDSGDDIQSPDLIADHSSGYKQNRSFYCLGVPICDFIFMRKWNGQSLRRKKGLSTTASLHRRGAIGGIVYKTNKLLAMCEMWKLQKHSPMLFILTILWKSSCLTADLWSSQFWSVGCCDVVWLHVLVDRNYWG